VKDDSSFTISHLRLFLSRRKSLDISTGIIEWGKMWLLTGLSARWWLLLLLFIMVVVVAFYRKQSPKTKLHILQRFKEQLKVKLRFRKLKTSKKQMELKLIVQMQIHWIETKKYKIYAIKDFFSFLVYKLVNPNLSNKCSLNTFVTLVLCFITASLQLLHAYQINSL